MIPARRCPPALLTLMLVLGLARPALADGDRHERGMPPGMPKAYLQECGSCHAAYPPGMLPPASWARITGSLDRHYGSDASLDAATLQPLSNWLVANAGTYKRVREVPPEDRITRSAWFARKHDEVAAAVWKLPSVKTPANCAACHTDTEQGGYSEHKLRQPAGMSWWQRRAWWGDRD